MSFLAERSALSHRPFRQRLMPALVGAGFEQPDYWVWCGSPVRAADGRCHLFASRWPKHLPFLQAYQSYSEIVRASAERPDGLYQFEEVVLPDRGAAYWDGRMTHNPTVHKIGDRYCLFYIGTTFTEPRPGLQELLNGPRIWPWYRSIKIGLAQASSPSGPWQRPDRPLLDSRPGCWDERVVTNPAVCVVPQRGIFVYYRSFIPNVGNRLGLAIFEDLSRAPVWRSERPLFNDPNINIEDPFVWFTGSHFEMIVKDLSGSLCGEYHGGVHLLSTDGIDWRVAPEAQAWSRTLAWSDGSSTTLGGLERPQLLFEGGEPRYLFAAMANGTGNWQAMTRTWSGVIPLRS